jgi:hypothetical protein
MVSAVMPTAPVYSVDFNGRYRRFPHRRSFRYRSPELIHSTVTSKTSPTGDSETTETVRDEAVVDKVDQDCVRNGSDSPIQAMSQRLDLSSFRVYRCGHAAAYVGTPADKNRPRILNMVHTDRKLSETHPVIENLRRQIERWVNEGGAGGEDTTPHASERIERDRKP